MLTTYNPDVLTCLANLSNDEVFTPPNIANQMLDLLPAEIWRDKHATFLDPACKSGVFLREIAKRLMTGLEKEIPNQQKRIDHIFTKQLFGIAITDMTALLSRRSLYCSKKANGKYSICEGFDSPDGNIIFGRVIHVWDGERCKYCGANIHEYDRDESLETHAYQFIHTDDPLGLFDEWNEEKSKMKFDVIVGNPPYQMGDGGHAASAIPIYHKFVQQAKKLKPRFLTMIIPSRWFTGGRGLDSFRDEMLNDKHIRIIHDFLNAGDCFPGVEIKGGVNYFLWARDEQGDCKIFTHEGNAIVSQAERPLLEDGADTFVRYNEAISLLHKVQKLKEDGFTSIVSANDPFGFDVREENSYKRIKPTFRTKSFADGIKFYYYGWQKKGVGYVDIKYVRKNLDYVNKWKVYISSAYGAGESFPHQILNKPLIGEPKSCCSETYLCIGPLKNKKEAENVSSYIQTKFFRFLVLIKKNTQHAMKPVYSLVPTQDFNEAWTDEKLYKKYKLTKAEIEFIEKMIRPMDNGAEADE